MTGDKIGILNSAMDDSSKEEAIHVGGAFAPGRLLNDQCG
jgi:hypothetical protein